MREALEDFLNYETETIKELVLDLDQRIDRNRYQISSAESKIQRVDPESAEFEDTRAINAILARICEGWTRDRLQFGDAYGRQRGLVKNVPP